MSLQCHKCESRNTEVVNADELSDKTENAEEPNHVLYNRRFNPVLPIGPLGPLGMLFGLLTDKEKKKRKIVVCKDCGYWEKV